MNGIVSPGIWTDNEQNGVSSTGVSTHVPISQYRAGRLWRQVSSCQRLQDMRTFLDEFEIFRFWMLNLRYAILAIEHRAR